MKFAHMGDCHLGGWRQPELRTLNFLHFQEACRRSIRENVDFILISGDLFDSPYPPIEVLKDTFEEFKKIKEANIPVFIIAGSHDYSVSGKTFLDVLEKAGFCENVFKSQERQNKIVLEPTIIKGVAIYGYPGKKSGLEVDEIEKIKLQDSPGLFKILMLHTVIKEALRSSVMKAVDEKNLPRVDYLALSHLHINYNKEGRVYSGPTFPNSISELEELKAGSFYIFDNGKIRREEIKIKEVFSLILEISDALTATEKILALLKTENLKDKIAIIRLLGILEKGKVSDIDFQKIYTLLKEKEVYAFLKSTTKLYVAESEIKADFLSSEEMESAFIDKFIERNPSKFNSLIAPLINSLKVEKLEDESSNSFEERVLSETKKSIEYEVKKN